MTATCPDCGKQWYGVQGQPDLICWDCWKASWAKKGVDTTNLAATGKLAMQKKP